MKRRGIGLGVTLVIVALVAVVGFALAGLVVTRLGLQSRLEQRQIARNLAFSAIAEAVATLGQDAALGQSADFQVSSAENAAWVGRLTFDPAVATRQGLTLSWNNLNRVASATTPDGRSVPPRGARLVGEGQCGPTHQRVEAILQAPFFPFAIACAGELESRGGLIVASVQDYSADTLSQLRNNPALVGSPAHMVSNSAAPGGLRLLGQSTVCGDILTSGTASLVGQPIRVLGEVREHQEGSALPTIPLSDFNPQLLGLPQQTLAGGNYPTLSLSQNRIFTSALRVTGNLQLDNAVVYVKGNLQVDGKLSGQGILVVEGSTRLRGSADFLSSSRVGVISQGDLTLEGSGAADSFFQGTVYTTGRLQARRLTVVGTLLASGPATSVQPQVLLDDVVVVQDNNPIATTPPVSDLSPNVTHRPSATVTRFTLLSPGHLQLVNLENGVLPRPLVKTLVDLENPASVYAAFLTLKPTPTKGLASRVGVIDPIEIKPTLDYNKQNEFAFAVDLFNQVQEFLLQQAPPPGTVQLDVSRFVSIKERMRLATYRDLP